MTNKSNKQIVVENCVSTITYWYGFAKDKDEFIEKAYQVLNAAYEAATKITKKET